MAKLSQVIENASSEERRLTRGFYLHH